jgi:hypothetical protein
MKLKINNTIVTIKNEPLNYNTSLDELVNKFKKLYINEIIIFQR